jgi:hypothetical protein
MRPTPAQPTFDPMKKTSPLSIALAFLVVALPLGWGLYRSVMNSKPLFSAAKAPLPAAAPAPGTAPAASTAPAVAPAAAAIRPSAPAVSPIRLVVPTAAPAAPAGGPKSAPPPDS